MSFLDKLREMLIEKAEQKGVVVAQMPGEKISFADLAGKIEGRLKEVNVKEKKLKEDIFNKIKEFDVEIQKGIKNLDKVDLSNKKEQEKVKTIVKENMNLYVFYLEKMIKGIKNDEQDVKMYIHKVYSSLTEFNRISVMPYEKATILVGNEMAALKLMVKNLCENVDRILRGSEKIFGDREIINSIRGKMNEAKQNEENIAEIEKKVVEFNESIKKSEEEQEAVRGKILDVRNGEAYGKDMERKKEHENHLKDLEDEVQSIKQKVDFKLLSRVFHTDKKKMQTINDFSSNFRSSVENSDEIEIIGLIRESNQDMGFDPDYLRELKSKIVKSKRPFVTETDREIGVLEAQIGEIGSKIEGLRASIGHEQKRKDKLRAKSKEIEEETKKIAKKLNYDID